MDDYSHFIIADIHDIMFRDRNYNPPITFAKFVGDSRSMIVKDWDGQKYRVTVTREEM